MPIAQQLSGIAYRAGHTTIVEGVDLDVRYGEVLALVGPNGAGKSTLLGILAGDIEPSEGTVALDGRPLGEWSTAELARTRAVLLQANQVSFSFTVEQVVEMGRAPWIGTEASADDQRLIDGAVAESDIAHLLGRGFPTLSGGEKARASLARVLAQDTRIVLLDEPTAALDLRHQEDVLRVARRLAGEGKAVIAVLHDLSLAAAYADEVAMLSGGRVAARGTPVDVLTEARVEEVYGAPVRVIPDPDTGRPIVIPRRSL